MFPLIGKPEPQSEEDDSDASDEDLDDSQVIFNVKPNGKRKGNIEDSTYRALRFIQL